MGRSGSGRMQKAHAGSRLSLSERAGTQTLYYFSVNVDNDGFKTSGFMRFCERLGTGDAFVKSASYLMHRDHFSEVRNFLLEQVACYCRTTPAYLLPVLIRRTGSCVCLDITPGRSAFSPIGTNRNLRNCLIGIAQNPSSSGLVTAGAHRLRT